MSLAMTWVLPSSLSGILFKILMILRIRPKGLGSLKIENDKMIPHEKCNGLMNNSWNTFVKSLFPIHSYWYFKY